jgi:hypothetical protein
VLRIGVMMVVAVMLMVRGMIYVAAMSPMVAVASTTAMGIVSRLLRTAHGLPSSVRTIWSLAGFRRRPTAYRATSR